ncbi:MAG: periplasmic heavy metal sensor [Hyphomicrobiaceae bacterium]
MSDQAGTAETPRRGSRWVKWALVASLALNLLVAGALATAAWRHRNWGPAGSSSIYGFVRSLPETRRAAILRAADAERQKLRPYWAELRQARSDVAATLSAKPFDATKFTTAHDKLLAAEVRARTLAHDFFRSIVDKLDDNERVALGQWLAKRERRSRRRDAWRRHRSSDESSQ